ncbi:branched-chain amino acid ABC transporter substrate-binding protein [Aquabacterium humicola]|uniref:branched-chain amino acid ABC transporter substrate-binding protein n=1 Tax=Aquabacterium humicola TaxID=3237377 RepID=UPI002543589D|nr:branched-chain amino acid ABC transporter substrate-binding protein [Rubrivivax pictus]
MAFGRTWARRAAGLAACWLATATAQPVLTVKIGHAATTSGWASVVGIESENAARLAIERLNTTSLRIDGRQAHFELVTDDDQDTEAGARRAAQALLRAGVSAVVGHMTSGTTIAAGRLYAEAGIALIAPSATVPELRRQGPATSFRLVADDRQVAQLLGLHAVQQLGLRRFAVLDDGSVYGRGLAEQFTMAVRAAGARVVEQRRIEPDAEDFGEFLEAAAERAADAVVFGGFDPQAGQLLRQMNLRGLRARFITGDGPCTPDLVSYHAIGAAMDDQVLCALPGGMPGGDDPAIAAFVGAYARRFGAEPRFYGAHVHDAVLLIADAMQRAGTAEPARVLEALASTAGFTGLTGTITFDERGERVRPPLGLYTYRGELRRLVRTVR